MPLLVLSDVGKRFAGLEALRRVSLSIEAGKIYGLIGPNGAGKTTLFNAITGFFPATSGRIEFESAEITHARPHEIARRGIARTYQLVRPFYELNVVENVKVGILFGRAATVARADLDDEALAYLKRVGLAHKADEIVTDLNLGERKRLEIAKALAARPKLLMFDEVLAGLNPTEIAQAVELFQGLLASGITILMIEHNMQAIMNACSHIFVLHHGELIAQGSPSQVSANPTVIEAYLGRKDLKLERRSRPVSHA